MITVVLPWLFSEDDLEVLLSLCLVSRQISRQIAAGSVLFLMHLYMSVYEMKNTRESVSSDGRVSGEGLWSSSLCLHRFIIELCQPIQVKQLDIANFEIFSSNPKDFVVSISDRSALMGSVTDWLCIYGFSITKSYHFFLFVIFTCSTSVCMCYNVSWLVYT